MPDGQTIDERHGCIVCGKTYTLRVTYSAAGVILSCIPANPDARLLPAPNQLLVACSAHSGSDVGAALTEHFFGPPAHDHEPEEHDEAS